jgi:heptose-I-phosphate ethanolaminephosphotransferase
MHCAISCRCSINAVTPRPYTIEALQQVLTCRPGASGARYLTTPSVINLMKQV